MYLIITYLTFFRLEELGFNEYRKFIESQEPDKMTGEHPMRIRHTAAAAAPHASPPHRHRRRTAPTTAHEPLPPRIGFLSYSFDVARLANSTKWDWIKLYDLDFVEETMLGPIEQHTKVSQPAVDINPHPTATASLAGHTHTHPTPRALSTRSYTGGEYDACRADREGVGPRR